MDIKYWLCMQCSPVAATARVTLGHLEAYVVVETVSVLSSSCTLKRFLGPAPQGLQGAGYDFAASALPVIWVRRGGGSV